VTVAGPQGDPVEVSAAACPVGCGSSQQVVRDADWHRAARRARLLAWISLAWMLVEGAVGLWQGLLVGSIALTGWALGSAVEGLASVIVVWRFTGSRTVSETAERRAQRGVAVSFWLIAPYVTAESLHNLVSDRRAETTVIGIAITAMAVVLMPVMGYAKRRLSTTLDSAATAGEGTQNYLCAAPRSLPVHYGSGIPGVNAPGIPGVTCNAGDGGPGAGTGRPGISGASVGRSSGGIPSVGKTGALQKPSGAMWSLQKFVEFITTMYSLHNPGGLGAGAIAPSGQRHVQLRAPTPAPPNAKLPQPLVAWPITPLTPKPPASQCICEPLISVG
jgi:hypothetical protein